MQAEYTGQLIPVPRNEVFTQPKRVTVQRRLALVSGRLGTGNATPPLDFTFLKKGPNDLQDIPKVSLVRDATLHEADLFPSRVECGIVQVVTQRVFERLDGRERKAKGLMMTRVLRHTRLGAVPHV